MQGFQRVFILKHRPLSAVTDLLGPSNRLATHSEEKIDACEREDSLFTLGGHGHRFGHLSKA